MHRSSIYGLDHAHRLTYTCSSLIVIKQVLTRIKSERRILVNPAKIGFNGQFPRIYSGDSRASRVFGDDGMRRIVPPFFRASRFFSRPIFSSSPQSTSFVKSALGRLPSRQSWNRAWQYFLWVPAIIFVNDHVVSISPVNGISMRPTVIHTSLTELNNS
jgi:hypothetical protein